MTHLKIVAVFVCVKYACCFDGTFKNAGPRKIFGHEKHDVSGEFKVT